MRKWEICVTVSGMDFTEFLKLNSKKIDEEVAEILQNELVFTKRLTPQLNEFKKASIGGKRVRGALVLLGYRIAGGKNSKEILKASAAFEIFQTSILAQDDVIDKSLTRRGKKSLAASLGNDHKALADTICLTDLGFFISYKTLALLKIEEKYKNQAIVHFSEMSVSTGLGEMLDVEISMNNDISEGEILEVAKLKTAIYTISGPLVLGAILAGAKDKLIEELENFGENLGVAFQIQDDILGVFGTEKKTGKSDTSDIEEGKKTLLLSHALENAKVESKRTLVKIYGSSNIDKLDLEQVKKIFTETGSLDYAKARAEDYFSKAESTLKNPQLDVLRDLIDFIAKRESSGLQLANKQKSSRAARGAADLIPRRLIKKRKK